uniref:Putative secreted protein n=1 Tax=Amblyomma tuberculatum TaxID=48802 RepID=A0A6M2E802_9ACAR
MMALGTMLAAFVSLILAAPSVHCYYGWCDVGNMDLMEEVVASTLREMPEKYDVRVHGLEKPVEKDAFNMSGLNSLFLREQLRGYCSNGTQVVNFELRTREPLLFTVNETEFTKHCTIGFQTDIRVLVEFRFPTFVARRDRLFDANLLKK